jgi:3-oxoacyl-[acyl-carrier-protein] synthase-3
MIVDERIAIVGTGYALGDTIRGNDDPIFAYLRANPPPNRDLFEGLTYRRALAGGQSVVSISVQAAQQALDEAELQAGQIDMVLGTVSAGEYCAPSALAAVHAELGLPDSCRTMALNSEYTGFLDGLKLAHDLIENDTIGRALIVAGIDWTRHMDYHEAVCVAASDAAGAAVVGRAPDSSRFTLIDWDNQTDTRLYGALRMAPRPIAAPPTYADAQLFTTALMKLDDKTGADAVRNFGLPVPPQVVSRLLDKHGLSGKDIALVTHQTSKPVQDYWISKIQPACYITTLTELADMVSASIPVNLAKCYSQITKDYLVLLGIGMEMRATALLYGRRAPS